MIALLAAAWAGAPDKVGLQVSVGAEVGQIAIASDGAFLALRDEGTTNLWLLDPATFELFPLETCTGSSGAAIATLADAWSVWTGCDDGTVCQHVVDADGVGDCVSFEVGEGAVTAVETDDAYVYALVESDGVTKDYALAVDSGSAASGYWGSTLGSPDVADLVLLDGRLMVIHGSTEVSWVDTATGSVANSSEPLGGRAYVDGFGYGSTNTYLADTSGAVVRFDPSSEFSIVLDDVAEEVTGVGIEPDEGYLLVGTDEDLLVYDFDDSPGSKVATLSGVAAVGDMVFADGYAYATRGATDLLVLTDRPWVDAGPCVPDSALAGEEVGFTFTSDVAGEYEVRVGGGLAADGELVGSGSVAADEEVDVALVVDGSYAEGANYLWVFVEADGRTGHDATVLTVDNPPSGIALTEGDVGAGDETVYLTIPGISDEDLASYTVYLTGEAFTAADYPSGGPDFVGGAEATVNAPLKVSAAPGEDVDVSFTNLLNDTPYYLAVRATDASETEGPMSNVMSVVPSETYSASELRGDPGGYCACGATRRSPALALVALGLVGLRRRGRSLARLGGRVGVGLLIGAAPVAAEAKDPDPPHFHARVYGGSATLADTYIQDIFGTYNLMLRGDYGVTTRNFEIGLGAGYLGKSGYLQMASGEVSIEETRLTVLPLSLSATVRLDFFEEQILVPVGGAGLDYWMWKEKWWVQDEDEDDHRQGAKIGWHWTAGLWLLLDPIDRRAASELDAKAGINDSYLTFEYRHSYIQHGDNLLDFSGQEFLVGVKVDF